MRKKATNSDNDNNIKTTIITIIRKIYNWMHYLRVEIQWRKKKGDRQTMLNQEEQQKYL